MLSRIDAFARPVRTVASSLRKSSTAFSMRVFAATVASFVEPIVDMISFPRSKCGTTYSSPQHKTQPCRAQISRAVTALARRNFRTDAIPLHHALYVAVLSHVEHHNGHAVVHAK